MRSRLNAILVLIALACALSIVASNHRARKLQTELENEKGRMQALEVEWGQLQLEQSTWANHARIEKIARDKLQMKTPHPAQVLSIGAVDAPAATATKPEAAR